MRTLVIQRSALGGGGGPVGEADSTEQEPRESAEIRHAVCGFVPARSDAIPWTRLLFEELDVAAAPRGAAEA